MTSSTTPERSADIELDHGVRDFTRRNVWEQVRSGHADCRGRAPDTLHISTDNAAGVPRNDVFVNALANTTLHTTR